MLVFLVHPLGHAQGLSTNVELVRPMVGGDVAPGLVDNPEATPGTWAWRTAAMYVAEPVVITQYGQEQGAAVPNRLVFTPAARFQATQSLAIGAALPTYSQWGDSSSVLSAPGQGLGDTALWLQLAPDLEGPVSVSLLPQLTLPTSRSEAWMGSSQPRIGAGAAVNADVGSSTLAAHLSITNALGKTEGNINGQDLSIEETPHFDFGLGGHIQMTEGLFFTPAVVGRMVKDDNWTYGAPASLEALAGVRSRISQSLHVDGSLGRGLSAGLGASNIRALLGLSFSMGPEAPEPTVVVTNTDPVPDLILTPNTEPEAPIRELTDAVEVKRDRIVVLQPVRFEQGTAQIEASSYPLLGQVAQVVQGDATIGLLTIVGHASHEGGYAFNYKLSNERALAVFQHLLLAGVDPTRMAIRGMGEVSPDGQSQDQNRRVEFLLSRSHTPLSMTEEREIKLPWNGQAHKVTNPPDPRRKPTDAFDPRVFQEDE